MSPACSTIVPSLPDRAFRAADQRRPVGHPINEWCGERRPEHRPGHEVRSELLEHEGGVYDAEPDTAGAFRQQQPEDAELRHRGPVLPVDGGALSIPDCFQRETFRA